ncbi:Darcynin [Chromobacterium amazonense]|uniref:Darcynin n=1 Tax=Chromobacterium amazonense TaxID=1382803 RepID=A0A2S9WZP8_9NEIS|nr:darcynin family protein [Chromobacterium amazonense]PRP68941.1 Darcynin [Chromobacterium amazonense]
MSQPMTFFALMRVHPNWLRLSRPERRRFEQETLQPIYARFPGVKMRWFDAEAFTTRCSDVAMFEAESVKAFYFLIDALRDSPLMTEPYFEFVDIIPAVEDGFRDYDAQLAR